jgi:UDP-N-acetylmuramoylalanine--D-glutamate ligase
MYTAAEKTVAVIGLDSYGLAACELLHDGGATVRAIDPGVPPPSPDAKRELAGMGIPVAAEAGAVDWAVASPSVPFTSPPIQELRSRQVPVISELELGYQHCLCLTVAVAGTNGKGTAAAMTARVMERGQRRVLVAGDAESPLCRAAALSREQDFVVVETGFGQLEGTDHFRPAVAVLLNLTPTLPPRYLRKTELARRAARLFANQQCFDWAVVQSEALAELRAVGAEPPSKVITFSASNRRADLWYDRGLLQSRLEGWTGPLLDIAKCRVQGPHQAENLMAALAVGHVMRIPLEAMVEALREFEAAGDCGEVIRERHGVKFASDARSANPAALRQALLAVPPGAGGEPNIWLIAGGDDEGYEYHDLGPLLSNRVKRSFLVGKAGHRMRAAWSLFTPCTVVSTLLEAVQNAADMAERGDVVLFSPACSSCSEPLSYPFRGQSFRDAVKQLEGMATREFRNPSTIFRT